MAVEVEMILLDLEILMRQNQASIEYINPSPEKEVQKKEAVFDGGGSIEVKNGL